jgi:hypothetical protein
MTSKYAFALRGLGFMPAVPKAKRMETVAETLNLTRQSAHLPTRIFYRMHSRTYAFDEEGNKWFALHIKNLSVEPFCFTDKTELLNKTLAPIIESMYQSVQTENAP